MVSQSRRVRTEIARPPSVEDDAVAELHRNRWTTGGCSQRSPYRVQAYGNNLHGGGNVQDDVRRQTPQQLHYLLKMGQPDLEHRRRPMIPKGRGMPERRGLKTPKSGLIAIQSIATTKDPQCRWVETMKWSLNNAPESVRSGRNEVWWPKTIRTSDHG